MQKLLSGFIIFSIMRPHNEIGQIATWLTGAALAILLLILAIPIFSPQNENLAPMPEQRNMEPQGGGPGVNNFFVDINDINSNPEAYTGREIRINGEISEILASGVLRLDQEETINGDEILVIIRPNNNSGNVNERNSESAWNVVVRGEVRKLNVSEIERELGLDLSSEIEEKYQGEYVIVADLITPISERR